MRRLGRHLRAPEAVASLVLINSGAGDLAPCRRYCCPAVRRTGSRTPAFYLGSSRVLAPAKNVAVCREFLRSSLTRSKLVMKGSPVRVRPSASRKPAANSGFPCARSHAHIACRSCRGNGWGNTGPGIAPDRASSKHWRAMQIRGAGANGEVSAWRRSAAPCAGPLRAGITADLAGPFKLTSRACLAGPLQQLGSVRCDSQPGGDDEGGAGDGRTGERGVLDLHRLHSRDERGDPGSPPACPATLRPLGRSLSWGLKDRGAHADAWLTAPRVPCHAERVALS